MLRKKLATAIKGSKKTKLRKASAKRKAVLDKKANPKALALSRKRVQRGIKKLGLVSAGFGRYHKGKGKPITHWVMRGKNGLYVLADKALREKLTGKKVETSPKPSSSAPAAPAKKHAGGRISNARKAHEAQKAELTRMHVNRLDKKRAEELAKKGKAADKPLTKKEQAKREASIRKLHRVLDKHFKKQQQVSRQAKKVSKKVTSLRAKKAKIINKHVLNP